MVMRSDARTGPSAVECSAAAVAAALTAAAESLQARLELVLDERLGALTADQRGFLEVAKKDGARLLKLIGDFQEIALADAGLLELDWSRFDLGDAVNEALAAALPRAHALDKDIVVNAPEPVTVTADAGRVRKSLAGLVQQAVHHSAPGCSIQIEVAGGGLRIAYEAETAPPEDSLALAQATAIARAHGGSFELSVGEERVEIAVSFLGPDAELFPLVAAA